MNKFSINEKGSALFMTLMILAGMMTVTIGVANLIVPGIVMGRSQNYSTVAFFAAEAGAERSLWEVRKNTTGFAMPAPGVISQADIFVNTFPSGSTYNVNYASSSLTISFISNGAYLGMRRSVQIQYPH